MKAQEYAEDTEPVLAHMRQQREEIRESLRDNLYKLAIHEANVQLQEHQAWKHLCKVLADLEQETLDRLRARELTPYQLGRAQGFLRACRLLSKASPMDEKAALAIRGEVDMQLAKLESLDKAIE